MRILWIDPFHGGSHAAVAAGYAARAAHQVRLLTLSQAGGWRWRMRGGAVTLARMARALGERPDLIVVTDMLDLATFRALTADCLGRVPVAVYFHENQLTYPLPPTRQRDLGLAWINYTSALVAEAVIFNSDFHRRDFLGALGDLLSRYHDHRELETIEAIAAKSHVLPPGIDLSALDAAPADPAPPEAGPLHILWNSRWEYDKQPGAFFAALEALEERGADFRLIVAGEHIDPRAPAFAAARERWRQRIAHWGYAPSRSAYAALLRRADVVVSTALQEYFGIAVVEALYCGCAPVLPRRLNYPDLLPASLHPTCLYTDHNALVDLLLTHCRPGPRPERATWRAIAAPYDWRYQAPRYDQLFTSLR